MTAPDDDSDMAEDAETIAARRRLADALDTLPRLTRTAFMLHSADRLSYEHIAWRCGMTVDEVTIRMAEALTGIRRFQNGQTGMMGRIRRAAAPWRIAWMHYRHERMDRRLGITSR
jgi:DNA-directed RNA polymerase specialized sigma24 family protein